MTKEEKEPKSRYGTLNFEKRKHPRFSVDLPIEYYPIDSSIGHTGKTLNISQGGLLLHFPEQMDMGQYIWLKLFFPLGSELNTIEVLAEVVWVDHIADLRNRKIFSFWLENNRTIDFRCKEEFLEMVVAVDRGIKKKRRGN